MRLKLTTEGWPRPSRRCSSLSKITLFIQFLTLAFWTIRLTFKGPSQWFDFKKATINTNRVKNFSLCFDTTNWRPKDISWALKGISTISFIHSPIYNFDDHILIDIKVLAVIDNDKNQKPATEVNHKLWLGAFEGKFDMLRQLILVNSKTASGWKIIKETEFALKLHIDDIEIIWSKIEVQENYWKLMSKDFTGNSHAFLPFCMSRAKLGSLSLKIPSNIPNYVDNFERSFFIPCNMTRVTEYWRRYPELAGEKHVISAWQFEQAMQYMYFLRSLGVTPFLSSGTLLGWYRECSIIPHTTDIDFAAFPEQYNPEVLEAIMQNENLKMMWIYGKPSDSLEIGLSAGGSVGAHVDLFFIYPDGSNHSYVSGMLIQSKSAATELRWYYPGHVTKLCSTDLMGHLVLVPCNPELIIFGNYGPNWNKPLHHSKYDIRFGRNLKRGRVYKGSEMREVVQLWWPWET